MEMNKENRPVLTVAIPTYKRPELLKKCLDSIFASIGSRDVEVLVMDDSIDSTNAEVKRHAQASFQNLVWKHNQKNLGIDANICACLENARGQYVWLIGEDDLMRRESIDVGLRMIANLPGVPFIFANYSYITSDHRLVLRERSIDVEDGPMDFREFVENYLWSAGFIGGCIFNRDQFLVTDYKSFIGTYYAHVAGLCLMAQGKQIGIIARPQVGNRVGNSSTFTWSDDSFGVFQGWRILLRRLAPVLGETTYRRAYENHRESHGYLKLKFLVTKKADGLLTRSAVEKSLTSEVDDAERRRVEFVTTFVPQVACKLARFLYTGLRRRSLSPYTL
jgi:abequosyltransferase